MTTNPNNAVGTNGAYSGRTSPNALNDVLATFQGRGVLSGWGCVPDSGMTVEIGGNGTDRDVAIAEDNAGNKVPVDNISQAPISVTIPAAPANNSRIDSIVAYVENPPMGTSSDTDNPGAVGLIVVSGTVASTPTAPTDNEIRTGITADGASGSTAYYVVLANVTVASGTSTITGANISAGPSTGVKRLGGIMAEMTVSDVGYGTTFRLVRLGNVVFAAGTFVETSMGQHDQTSVGGTVPAGFRPSKEFVGSEGCTYVPFATSQTEAATTGGWTIYPDGTVKFSNAKAFSGAARFFYNGSYITDDPWPSS